MREQGRIVPVTDRRCMSPIYNFVRKSVATKGMLGTLADIKQPDSPLMRGLRRIREGYSVTGTRLSPIGQAIREKVTTPQALRAVVVFEAAIQKVEQKVKRKLPHFDNIAQTALMLTGGVFGAESSSSRTFDEPEEETTWGYYLRETQGDNEPFDLPSPENIDFDFGRRVMDNLERHGRPVDKMRENFDRLEREYNEDY